MDGSSTSSSSCSSSSETQTSPSSSTSSSSPSPSLLPSSLSPIIDASSLYIVAFSGTYNRWFPSPRFHNFLRHKYDIHPISTHHASGSCMAVIGFHHEAERDNAVKVITEKKDFKVINLSSDPSKESKLKLELMKWAKINANEEEQIMRKRKNTEDKLKANGNRNGNSMEEKEGRSDGNENENENAEDEESLNQKSKRVKINHENSDIDIDHDIAMENESNEKKGQNDNDDDENEEEGEGEGGKNPPGHHKVPTDVRDNVCPLHVYPYDIQLRTKHNKIYSLLRKFTGKLRRDQHAEPGTVDKVISSPSSDLKNDKDKVRPVWWKGTKRTSPKHIPSQLFLLPYYIYHSLCPVHALLPSPVINGYRNKCEFSCGLSQSGLPTCGFLLGAYRNGIVTVGEADDCVNCPLIAIGISKLLTFYMRNREKYKDYPTYNKVNHQGFYRLVTVRNTFDGELMINIQVDNEWKDNNGNVVDLKEFGDDIRKFFLDTFANDTEWKEKYCLVYPEVSESIADIYTSHDKILEFQKEKSGGETAMKHITTNSSVSSSPSPSSSSLTISSSSPFPPPPVRYYRIGSLLLQGYHGQSNAAPSSCLPTLLYGSKTIKETLLGLQFHISLNSFFQVNLFGAASLYMKAFEWSGMSKDTILFDICCGTGTIGMVMSRHVKEVIGVEMVESAVEDANENAKLNKIENIRFLCGKAEDVLAKAIAPYSRNPHLIGIVDPPRSGLHPSVLNTLRHTSSLSRLVYISCNPVTLVRDIATLIAPKTMKDKSDPFVAVKSVGMDMFPHTEHCEMIMLLERRSLHVKKEEAKGRTDVVADSSSSSSSLPLPLPTIVMTLNTNHSNHQNINSSPSPSPSSSSFSSSPSSMPTESIQNVEEDSMQIS